MVKGKTRTNQPITELTGVGSKMYKHDISLQLKTATLTLNVNCNIVSTDSKQITGNFGSGSYFIINFNTTNIIGFLGGASVYSLQVTTTSGTPYVIRLTNWGAPNYGFGSEHVKTYGGGEYFGSDNPLTECSLTDNVTEL